MGESKMKNRFLATALIISACSSVMAGELNTRDRVAELGKGLSEAWMKFNTDAQKVTRQQTITDINSIFTREINNAAVPPNQKLLQVIKGYIANLERANEYFRTEKMKAERSTYIKGCT